MYQGNFFKKDKCVYDYLPFDKEKLIPLAQQKKHMGEDKDH